MNNRKNINDELKGLESSLPGDSHSGPFSVPEGYFDNLAGNILSRLQAGSQSAGEELQSLSPLLAGINRSMPYSVPQGFFDNNLEMLPILIGEDQRSAILELVERNTPYETPYDYFDQFPVNMLNKVRPSASVIRMRRTWMRMAVAAVFFGIIMISGFWFMNNQQEKNSTVAAQMKNVTNQELDEFIKNSTALPVNESSVNATASTEVKNLLNDVADKELENFLDDVPSYEMFAVN